METGPGFKCLIQKAVETRNKAHNHYDVTEGKLRSTEMWHTGTILSFTACEYYSATPDFLKTLKPFIFSSFSLF